MSVPRRALSVPEAAESLGLDVAVFDREVRPRLRIVRFGDEERVPVGELERLLAGPTPQPRRALLPQEAAAALGVGRTFFDEHIKPELRVVREGAKVLIPCEELDFWLGRRRSRRLGGKG